MFLRLLCFFLSLGAIGECIDEEKVARFEALVSQGMEQIPLDYQVWLADQQISSPKFLLDKKDFKSILKRIAAIATYVDKPATVGLQGENKRKNLHTSVIPYDDTRTLREKPGFYLSANDVITPTQAYIVSQAPQETVLQDFWTAIFEKDVRCIIALAMPEGECKEYACYFAQERFPSSISGWNLEIVEERVIATSRLSPNQCLIQRKFLAKKDGESRNIIHFHYKNWPDFKAPAQDLFQDLLTAIRVYQNTTILVHCSAGQGRSGTLVAADSILKENKTFPVNIVKRIIELRMQRKNLVGSPSQIEAVYQAVVSQLQ